MVLVVGTGLVVFMAGMAYREWRALKRSETSRPSLCEQDDDLEEDGEEERQYQPYELYDRHGRLRKDLQVDIFDATRPEYFTMGPGRDDW